MNGKRAKRLRKKFSWIPSRLNCNFQEKELPEEKGILLIPLEQLKWTGGKRAYKDAKKVWVKGEKNVF